MELQCPEICFLFLVSLVFIYLSKPWFLDGLFDKERKKKTIPSPTRSIPVLGHLHLLGKLPHRSLANLAKKHGPIMLLKLGCVPTVVISSPTMARDILKTHDHNFATRPLTSVGKNMAYNFRDMGFSPSTPSWKSLRKLSVLHLLGTKPVESTNTNTIRKQEISSMLRITSSHAQRGLPLNVKQLVASTTSNLLCRMSFGRKFNDDKDMEGQSFHNAVREGIRLAGAFNIGDFVPWINFLDLQGLIGRQKRCHSMFDNFIERVIEERLGSSQRRSHKDFLDNMLEAMSSTNLEIQITRDHVKATILDVLVAGIDTSAAALEWTISELLLNPLALKKTQEEIDKYADVDGGLVEESRLNEMKYLKAVIRESLRLHPSAPLLVPREAINTCKVADYEIAKGSRVLVNAWAISHSDDVWEEAETFKPERFLLPHNKSAGIDVLGHNNFDVLPFGSGRRSCPGSYMALRWMEYVVANLLHFFDLKLNNVGGLDMEEEFGLSVARATPLIVVPSRRCPSIDF